MEQTVSREKLVAEAKLVLEDVEGLLVQAAAASGQQAQDLRDRASAALTRAKQTLEEAQISISENTKAAARATDHWVHEHPWGAIGVGAGVGFLIGLLVARR